MGTSSRAPVSLTVAGGGTLKFENGYWSNPQGNLFQNTYAGGTIVDNAIADVSDNDAGSNVSGGVIVASVFGTGPITLNNGGGLQFDGWNILVLTNAINLNGTVSYNNTWNSGDNGHGLFISNADEHGNAMTTPNVTTIGAGGATLNLSFASPDLAQIDQQIVGGRLTVSNINGSTGLFVLTNTANTFAGLTVNSGTVLVNGVGPLGAGPLSVNGGGVIIMNSSAGAIFPMLQSGYNGGAWNGSTGINSTAAAADASHLHAVGMMQPAGNTTFEGQNVNNGEVLVKYTYYGDANLDGKVDGSDYSLIDNAYLADQSSPGSYSGWQNGDFNYDGVVDGSDYTLIDNAFNSQAVQIASLIASPSAIATAQIAGGSGTSAVPEPAPWGCLELVPLPCWAAGNRAGISDW